MDKEDLERYGSYVGKSDKLSSAIRLQWMSCVEKLVSMPFD